jgi:hypothetical protein
LPQEARRSYSHWYSQDVRQWHVSTYLGRQRLSVKAVSAAYLGTTFNPRVQRFRLRARGRVLAPSGPTLTALEIEPRHVDPADVLWATLKLIDVDKIRPQTTVVRFALRDRPVAGYWAHLAAAAA